MNDQAFNRLQEELIECRRCPRLVAWREQVGASKRAAFMDQEYWARPVPMLGARTARLLMIGLAPGAHGSNRTGRMFTGDRSGEVLFRALHRAGFANRPVAVDRNDGFELRDAAITAIVRCVPPANRPTPDERDTCAVWLDRELDLCDRVEVIVALGGLAFDQTLRMGKRRGWDVPRPRPKFGHGGRSRARWRCSCSHRLLPPFPTEHLHRKAHRGDAGQRVRESHPNSHRPHTTAVMRIPSVSRLPSVPHPMEDTVRARIITVRNHLADRQCRTRVAGLAPPSRLGGLVVSVHARVQGRGLEVRGSRLRIR